MVEASVDPFSVVVTALNDLEKRCTIERFVDDKKHPLAIYLLVDSIVDVETDVKTRLLDVAQRLIQTRGFHGFSYRDLANEVKITTASIHYHFPTKAELGVGLVRRYREEILRSVAGAATSAPHLPGQLEHLTASLFEDALSDGARVCLCAALAGEHGGLPPQVQAELHELITASEAGIAELMRKGQTRGELPLGADPLALARLWYSTLQGALVMARASRPETLKEVSRTLSRLTFGVA